MNQERIDRLFSCRNEQGFDSISYDKRKILEDLYKDSDIIEILNNKELQAVNACPEDYYNVNIYSSPTGSAETGHTGSGFCRITNLNPTQYGLYVKTNSGWKHIDL